MADGRSGTRGDDEASVAAPRADEVVPGAEHHAAIGIAIVGATATGKTALAIDVAEAVGGEIISMDSRQVYRGMDVGTAKATSDQRARVPHHGLDVVDPSERYSAGRFSADARRWIAEIRGRGRVPVLVGGTGFFLRALTHPLFREPELPPERRRRLQRYLDRLPERRLRAWLAANDPVSAERLRHGGGRQRASRALEVVLLTGRPLPYWHEHAPLAAAPVSLSIFVLELPRSELFDRIDRRVDRMVEDGLIEEVERLLASGYGPGDPGMSATGYAELVPYLRGERSLPDALDDVRRATRRYARRQQTWFRNQLPAGAHHLDARRPMRELTEEIVRTWRIESSGSG